MLRVCMTSDFFLEEADAWRDEAWDIIAQRPDVKFFLLTKRPERMARCLPADWGEGWDNVMLNVTCENQRRADERMPILMDTPAKHKGVMCAPLIGPVSLAPWLAEGQIEQVLADGENYDGARPCHYEWVHTLSDECRATDVTFVFCSLGNRFVKDGREYRIASSELRSEQAKKSGLSYEGRAIEWHLTDPLGLPIPEEELYVPHFRERCERCGMRPSCNGCSDCGRCE
jgi:protein gp37